MENERVSEINGRTDPDPPRSGLVQRIAFYPPKLEGNQVAVTSAK